MEIGVKLQAKFGYSVWGLGEMLPLKNYWIIYIYIIAARYITIISLGHVAQAAVQHRAHTQSLQCCMLEPVNLIARSSWDPRIA
jgi:hypothetical protein